MRQIGVQALRQAVPVCRVGQQRRVQRGNGAQLATGDGRLQRVHGAVGLALRLLRPGEHQRPDRIGQRLVRQFRVAQLRLLPLAVMRRLRCQQKLRQRVGWQGSCQLRGLAVAGEQRQHERVFPQLGIGRVASQRAGHAGRGTRGVALVRSELGDQEIRRAGGLCYGSKGNGEEEGSAEAIHQGSVGQSRCALN